MVNNKRIKQIIFKNISLTTVIVILVAILILITADFGCKKDSYKSETISLRIGWQPPWANQGQLVAIMKNTDILKQNSVKVEWVPFSYGGPMTEAALANRIDILFVGDQPAITLISRSNDWKIIARMASYRSGILVPIKSELNDIQDLIGKKVAAAFGSTTHRDTFRILSESNLTEKVKLVHLDQAEHAGIIEAGNEDKWGKIDAIATYDPTIAASLEKGKAKLLYSWSSPAVIVANQEILQRHRKELLAFLKAYIEAYVIYAKNTDQADKWYSLESRLPLNLNSYGDIAKYEPNMSAKNEKDVNISLKEDFIEMLQKNADVAFKVGIIKKRVIIGDSIVDLDKELSKQIH